MFPEMYKYYKVISERSSNEFRMEALTFTEHPTYWFNYQHLHNYNYSLGDYYNGKFGFTSIEVEDYPFFCYSASGGGINFLTEISLEEYNQALDSYIQELKEIKWNPDHCRCGGKFVTDPSFSKVQEEEKKES